MRSQGKVFLQETPVDTASSGSRDVYLGKFCGSLGKRVCFFDYNATAIINNKLVFIDHLLCAWPRSPRSCTFYREGGLGSEGYKPYSGSGACKR